MQKIKKLEKLMLAAALFAMIAIGSAFTNRLEESDQRQTELPTLTGKKAVEHIKNSGDFESLTAALIAARQKAQKTTAGASLNNHGNQIRAALSPSGFVLESTDTGIPWRSAWTLSGLAHGSDKFPVQNGEVETSSNRVSIQRPAGYMKFVEEWFHNTANGLEHGFTIPERLSQTSEPLRLTIKVEGDLKPISESNGQKLLLVDKRDEVRMNYDKLRVWDADGVEVVARMTTAEGEVILDVEETDARYPLTIDPTFAMSAKVVPLELATDITSFGYSVSISGNTVVIGAPDDDIVNDANQGSAYVFVRGSNGLWTQQAKLFDTNGSAGDFMGRSVSVSGDTAIVGAPGAMIGSNTDQGAIYVYVRVAGEWSLQQKVTAADGAASDRLGDCVDVSGDAMIAGSTNANAVNGAAYVFVRTSGVWTQQQKLVASDATLGDGFGISVAIVQTTVIVGAFFDNINGNNDQGSAYIFTRTGTTWTQQAKLFAADGSSNEYFGSTVDISTGFQTAATAVIGVYGDDIDGRVNQGSAYVFTRSGSTWTLQQKLFAGDPLANDFFGSAVAITGGTVIVGAARHFDFNDPNRNKGVAYLFTRSGGIVWNQKQKLLAYDGAINDQFGRNGLAISGDTAVFGADGGDSSYIFRFASKPFDFDDDSKTDIGIFRPNGGEWWYQRSSDLQVPALQFGASTDVIVPADYTGDGKTDIAIWRPSSGAWFILRSEDNSFYSFPFGTTGDRPVPADFDDDNQADPAIFRPSNSTWYIARSTAGLTVQGFGASGDVPVVGDYDADGRADVAIFRPSNGQWWINRSAAGVLALAFGNGSDRPVQGDYTGDGKTDIAFWRASAGQWFVLRSEDSSYYAVSFGVFGDLPAPGDYDGDGKYDTTIFRPSNATWYSQRSAAGTLIQQFGLGGDLPIASAFVP